MKELEKPESKELPDHLKVWLDEMLTDIVDGNKGRENMFEKAVNLLGSPGNYDVSEYERRYTAYKEENERKNKRTF